MSSVTLNPCVKCSSTEQIVEEQQQGIHTAQLNTDCVPGKNVNIHLKRTLAESSDPSSHMSYAGLLSPPNNYLCQQSILVAEERQPFQEMPAYFWDKGMSLELTEGCMHQMKMFFPSGAELGFAGQFHGEYIHF